MHEYDLKADDELLLSLKSNDENAFVENLLSNIVHASVTWPTEDQF